MIKKHIVQIISSYVHWLRNSLIFFKLREIEQVKDVFETIGTHDMMIKLEAENFEKIREIASRNIQKIEKIRTISTLIKKDK